MLQLLHPFLSSCLILDARLSLIRSSIESFMLKTICTAIASSNSIIKHKESATQEQRKGFSRSYISRDHVRERRYVKSPIAKSFIPRKLGSIILSYALPFPSIPFPIIPPSGNVPPVASDHLGGLGLLGNARLNVVSECSTGRRTTLQTHLALIEVGGGRASRSDAGDVGKGVGADFSGGGGTGSAGRAQVEDTL